MEIGRSRNISPPNVSFGVSWLMRLSASEAPIGHYKNEKGAESESIPQWRLGSIGRAGHSNSSEDKQKCRGSEIAVYQAAQTARVVVVRQICFAFCLSSPFHHSPTPGPPPRNFVTSPHSPICHQHNWRPWTLFTASTETGSYAGYSVMANMCHEFSTRKPNNLTRNFARWNFHFAGP